MNKVERFKLKLQKKLIAGSFATLLLVLAALLSSCAGGKEIVASGEWKTLDTNGEPTARHEAAMVEYKGKFYLMGGRGVKPVEEFDPETNTWSSLGPTPLEIHHFQPVVYGDLVFVMTAMTGKYPKETPLENIYIYNPDSDEWQQGPEIPEHRRRGGAGTVVDDGKIYIVGGIIDGHTSGTVSWLDEFDPNTGKWRELSDAPRVRDHCPAIANQNLLYCVGGRNTSFHTEENFTAFFETGIREVDVYSFTTETWTTLSKSLPVPTAAGGLVELNGDIYYFGGESGQKSAHNETQRLNGKTGSWELVAPLQRGRHGGGAVSLNEKIYVAAGSGNRGGGPELSSTEEYSLLQ